jgi:rhodanese-related sulfurtransferase
VRTGKSRLERGFDILSFCFAVVLVTGLAVRVTRHNDIAPSAEPRHSLRGQLLARAAPEVRWDTDRPTLVLALRSTCTYCQQSVPFHRKVIEYASAAGYRVMAFTDEPPLQMRAALRAEALEIPEVYGARFDHLGSFVGTPTLFLADRRGQIAQVWMGQLSPEREREVETALGVQSSLSEARSEDAGALLVPVATAADVANYEAHAGGRYILDVRPREQFRAGHLRGAINIPSDEIDTRTQHELPAHADTLVFCEYKPGCEQGYKHKGVLTNCTLATLELVTLGFNARLLEVDSQQLLASTHPAHADVSRAPPR